MKRWLFARDFTSQEYIEVFIYLLWINYEQVIKISKYFHRIDVILASLYNNNKFFLGTMKIELWKAYFLDDLMRP